jgi:hypothetical protein
MLSELNINPVVSVHDSLGRLFSGHTEHITFIHSVNCCVAAAVRDRPSAHVKNVSVQINCTVTSFPVAMDKKNAVARAVLP